MKINQTCFCLSIKKVIWWATTKKRKSLQVLNTTTNTATQWLTDSLTHWPTKPIPFFSPIWLILLLIHLTLTMEKNRGLWLVESDWRRFSATLCLMERMSLPDKVFLRESSANTCASLDGERKQDMKENNESWDKTQRERERERERRQSTVSTRYFSTDTWNTTWPRHPLLNRWGYPASGQLQCFFVSHYSWTHSHTPIHKHAGMHTHTRSHAGCGKLKVTHNFSPI